MLSDTLDIESKHLFEDKSTEAVSRRAQTIVAKLVPGQSDLRQTRYSMFGTGREISDFQLNILMLPEGEEQERCRAWGSVS